MDDLLYKQYLDSADLVALKSQFDTELSKFLVDYKDSDSNYSKVTKDDYYALKRLIQTLLKLKWATDCDGNLPITFGVLDKTKNHWIVSELPHEPTKASVQHLASDIEALSSSLRRILQTVAMGYRELK